MSRMTLSGRLAIVHAVDPSARRPVSASRLAVGSHSVSRRPIWLLEAAARRSLRAGRSRSGTVTSAAPATTRSSCSISTAIWSAVSCEQATPQCRGFAPGAGAGDRPLPRAGRRSVLPRRRGVRQARDLRTAGARGHPQRDPLAGHPGATAADRLFANRTGWATAQEADRDLCQLPLPSEELDCEPVG